MRRLRFLFMFVVTTALLAAVAIRREPSERVTDAATPAGEDKQILPRPHWDLKYRSGSVQAKKDEWLKAAFLTDEAEGEKMMPFVAIPRDEVRAIYFNPTAQKQSDVIQRMPRSGCYQAHYLMPKTESAPGPTLFVAWAASPGRLTRAAERLNERYPVRLVWVDNSVEKEIVFTVSYCEYASFLANLHWFAGERWKDLSREFPK